MNLAGAEDFWHALNFRRVYDVIKPKMATEMLTQSA